MATLFPGCLVPALDSNGATISGATWYFYRTGTTTPVSVYSTSTLTTALGTSVAGDAAGRFVPIYLDESVTYRAVLKDGDGVTIPGRDIDPVNPNGFGINVKAYGATGDGSTDDSTAFGLAIASGQDRIYLPDGTYRAKNLTANQAGQTFYGPGVLKFNGTYTDKLLTVTGDNVTFDGITFDGNLAQPSFALVAVNDDAARPRFLGCTFQNMLGTYIGATIYNQMYALAISPYGVTNLEVRGCRFENLKKKNDGSGIDYSTGLTTPAFEGGGFVGAIVFVDGSATIPTAAQTTATSGIITDCSFFDIQTVMANGLSDANRTAYDDADAIRFYDVAEGEGTVDVIVSSCQFRKVSKRALKISARGPVVENIDVFAADCPYYMVSAIKLNPDTTVNNVRVHASAAKPVQTAFQWAGIYSSSGVRYSALIDAYVSHCTNAYEFYKDDSSTVIENITVRGLKVVQCYGNGIVQSAPTPTTQRNLEFVDCEFTGGSAAGGTFQTAGISISNDASGSSGVRLSRITLKNCDLKVSGMNTIVNDVTVEVDTTNWIGRSNSGLNNVGLVEIGPGTGYSGYVNVQGLNISASGLKTDFMTASRPYVALLSADNLTVTSLRVVVPEGMATNYAHVEIAGDDVDFGEIVYTGPGYVAFGNLAKVQRGTIGRFTRLGSAAVTQPALYVTHASNTALFFGVVDDKRAPNTNSMYFSTGSLGSGDTYFASVGLLRTRQTTAVPSTGSQIHYADVLKY